MSSPFLSNVNSVYLDYNATTPVDPSVIDVITKTLKDTWANPGSNYKSGQKAAAVIKQARCDVARMIDANANDIVFASGGTEINNWVIQICVNNFQTQLQEHEDGPSLVTSVALPHIITTNIEHDSVRLPLETLSSEGKIDVSYIPVSQSTGAVNVDDVLNDVRPTTCLVTVMLANNETGAIQPVQDICQRIKEINKSRKRVFNIFTHTDAAQAIGKIPVSVNDLQVDYLTIVGHKFYGPRIGALYARRPGQDTPILPLFYGGGQERQMRPGTENVAMIAGLGKAAQLVCENLDIYANHMKEIRYYLQSRLKIKFGEKIKINSNFPLVLPNTCNVSFVGPGLEGYKILAACHFLEASVGAACHSNKKLSSVLLASGVEEHLAVNAIRLSVGRETTESEIDIAIEELRQAKNSLQSNTIHN